MSAAASEICPAIPLSEFCGCVRHDTRTGFQTTEASRTKEKLGAGPSQSGSDCVTSSFRDGHGIPAALPGHRQQQRVAIGQHLAVTQ